jgi:light-regulated signal transduction histidine kinase (bacteriophytochrome)
MPWCYLLSSCSSFRKSTRKLPTSKLLEDGLIHSSELYEENLGGYFIVTASPIKDDEGNLLGSIHIAHDITTRKQIEDKVEKHTEELARSNKELEQFAYVSSHDLKEPLRTITSFLQLLLNDIPMNSTKIPMSS